MCVCVLCVITVVLVAEGWYGVVGFALLADSEDATDTEQQQSDLDLLERWLTAAEVVLSSLCCKPQQLAKFEEALALHRVCILCVVISICMYSACAGETHWADY